MFSFDLLLDVLVAGILVGGFYAAVSVGITVAFGLLDVVNIAHPAFVILGAYGAYVANSRFGLDPIVAGLLGMPLFFLLGVIVYRVYYTSFEKRGEEALRGLVFFFGITFIIEVSLLLQYGVDYRSVDAPYVGETVVLGPFNIPFRLAIPFALALALTLALHLFLSKTFYGRAVKAVSQDHLALRLMGASPVRIKALAFAIAIATASIAGALLIMIGPIEPSVGREYIGRAFAIAVLGGMGSIGGTLAASLILGVLESLTSTFYGPSWALAVSFGILLLVLALRPAGLFGR
jgi:branched-chain amino acid transport system permease protein